MGRDAVDLGVGRVNANPAGTESQLLRLLGSNQGEDAPDATAILSQLAEEDPLLALVAQHLATRNNDVEEPTDDDDDDAEEAWQLEETRREVERYRTRALELEQRLRWYRRCNRTLAASLGACPSCWGADAECRRCEGDGRPGAFAPDRDLFAAWVGPALRRLQAGMEQDSSKQQRTSTPGGRNERVQR